MYFVKFVIMILFNCVLTFVRVNYPCLTITYDMMSMFFFQYRFQCILTGTAVLACWYWSIS